MANQKSTRKFLARRKIKFTLAALKELPAQEKPYPVYDTQLPGLRVTVYPTGTKIFQVYAKPTGSQRPANVRIGKLGSRPLSGEKSVYAEARRILALMESGINPNDQKREKKRQESIQKAENKAEDFTLQQALNEYLEAVKIRASSANNYRLYIEKHLLDWLHLPLVSISPRMVRTRHKEISSTHPAAANNVMRVLRALYNWAADEYEDNDGNTPIPPSPTRKLKRAWNEDQRRINHIASEQLQDWWDATEELAGTRIGVMGHPVPAYHGDGTLARDYLRFVLMTGCRRREASTLRWSDINLKAGTFTIRADNAKNKQVATLPLSDYLVAMLTRRKKLGAKGPFPIDETRRFVERVRELSGIEDFTVHGLRRSFISIASEMDISPYTVKKLVNHAVGKDITAGYDQPSMVRLRKATQQVTDSILSRVGQRQSVIELVRAE